MISRLYLEVVRALDARRRSLGWSMAVLDDMAGTQDGYFAKCLHADTPSGRQAGWEILQLYADALFPAGVTLVVMPSQRQARAAVAQRPKKPQTRLELTDDVLFAPRRAVPPKPMPPLGRPANGNTQQLALDVTVDTTPGRHCAMVSEAKRNGPKRVYRRGGVAA